MTQTVTQTADRSSTQTLLGPLAHYFAHAVAAVGASPAALLRYIEECNDEALAAAGWDRLIRTSDTRMREHDLSRRGDADTGRLRLRASGPPRARTRSGARVVRATPSTGDPEPEPGPTRRRYLTAEAAP